MFNLFRRREVVAPVDDVYTLFSDMARQPHLLIAGATGSGKSVVINGIMYNLLHETPDRAQLFAVQTPQVFDLDLLRAAHKKALKNGKELTDDCLAAEQLGLKVFLTQGEETNLKITTPLDLRIAAMLLEETP